MDFELFPSDRSVVKYWWLSLILGVFLMAVGIFCLFHPLEALLSFTALFVVSFIMVGFIEISFAVYNKDNYDNWGWSMVNGIVDVVIAFLILIVPLSAPIMMIYFVGFWIMFQAFLGIGYAFDLKRARAKGWVWLLALAIISIILASLFVVYPEMGGTFVVSVGSMAFVIYGVFRIVLAFQHKALKKDLYRY